VGGSFLATHTAAAATGEKSSSPMPSIFFMVLIFGIMWFFLIRPNQQRDKERKAMLAALGKGDQVITQGGICGTIVGLNEKTVVLKVSDEPATKMEFIRGAISQISSREDESKS